MPISIVVGGQFGSEGKGKTALEIVRRNPSSRAVVRVGGTNSGHTAFSTSGRRFALRQLPAACIDRDVQVVLPPGAYIDVDILAREIDDVGLDPRQVMISPHARVITAEHRRWEASAQLNSHIGSTESGTGAAVIASVGRGTPKLPLAGLLAEDVEELSAYLGDTTDYLRDLLNAKARIVIEGTQGYGLSLLHGGYWPKATSRDTTAASFLSEAGLSPFDVDDITLVIRTYPIRVAGDSGPLLGETNWGSIRARAGIPFDISERTTVTQRVRRVGEFDPLLVRRAIAANQPTRIVLNHLDYVDWAARSGAVTDRAMHFIANVEESISRKIDWVGYGPDRLRPFDSADFHRIAGEGR